MWRSLICLLISAGPLWAESVVATRSIPLGAAVTSKDVTLVAMEIPDALTSLEEAVGKIASSDITAGQALRADQIEQPLRIERNDIVAVILRSGHLEILTEGRALTAGTIGDVIDIMNMSSRARIKGVITADGTILVSSGQSSE